MALPTRQTIYSELNLAAHADPFPLLFSLLFDLPFFAHFTMTKDEFPSVFNSPALSITPQ